MVLLLLLLQSGMRWLESTYQQKARAWVVRHTFTIAVRLELLRALLPSQSGTSPGQALLDCQRAPTLRCHSSLREAMSSDVQCRPAASLRLAVRMESLKHKVARGCGKP